MQERVVKPRSFYHKQIDGMNFPAFGMPADDALLYIQQQMDLDGRISLDLGSFTTTRMHKNADELILQNLGKNLVNQPEFPRMSQMQQEVINMLATLYNASKAESYRGAPTVGSSEAIMLGLLSHKRQWEIRREKEGKSTANPNIVFSADAHICWHKFANYFSVELREIGINNPTDYPLEDMLKEIDENTIAVGAVLGTTYTGVVDPVKRLNSALEGINAQNGWDVGIHVDAASAGFILPFIRPELEWDFRLPLVRTINVSGHKFGMVYPDMGWLLFRDTNQLHDSLVYKVSYLGDEEETFTLNFSRGSWAIYAQYFNILHYGREGYKHTMEDCMSNATRFASYLRESGRFEVLSDLELPIVAFRFSQDPGFTKQQYAHRMKERNWMLPVYQLPKNLEGQYIMRVVFRPDMTEQMTDFLWNTMDEEYTNLESKMG
jgi:glutamate decarboxylase